MLKIDRMFKLKYSLLTVLLLSQLPAFTQYAPPAGQPGSTAIHQDSSVFVAWAKDCVVERGWVNVAIPDSGRVTYGADTSAIGKADNSVVSLGDGGEATLTFEVPIANGPGFDFAVFENSFLDDFLELAFAEVSSDGQNYFRFEASSLTQTDEQVETFGLLDATKIDNLAGKYRAGFGTPFDLEELKNEAGLDVNHIVAVRIVDVVGSIDGEYATYDVQGMKINDPWPTPFPTGGFDLDAVGVINNEENTAITEQSENFQLKVFPNPVSENIILQSEVLLKKIVITNLQGVILVDIDRPGFQQSISVSELPDGLLIVRCFTQNGVVSVKVMKE
jgi:hypothetical protein